MVADAIFDIADLPLTNAKPVEDAHVGPGLQEACNAELATDQRRVTAASRAWATAGELPLIEQWVVAYDRPVATDAVAEAKEAITCKDYMMLGVKWQILGPLDVGIASPGAGVFGFCESIGKKANIQCTVIAGRGDLACSVSATARQRVEAVQLILQMLPLVIRTCLQVVPSPTATP